MGFHTNWRAEPIIGSGCVTSGISSLCGVGMRFVRRRKTSENTKATASKSRAASLIAVGGFGQLWLESRPVLVDSCFIIAQTSYQKRSSHLGKTPRHHHVERTASSSRAALYHHEGGETTSRFDFDMQNPPMFENLRRWEKSMYSSGDSQERNVP